MNARTKHRRTSTGVLVLAVVLTVLAAGAAVARWSGAGSGSGRAVSGLGTEVTIGPGTPDAALYPGGSSAVRLTMSNPGTSSVRVGSLALASGEGVDGFEVDPGHPDCDEGDLGFTTQTNGGSGWTVAAGGSTSVTLAGSLTMALDASDGCQGATFTVYLTAVG